MEFFSELDSAILKIYSDPLRWRIERHDIRCYRLHRFPFAVYYRVIEGGIQIVAVSHQSLRPGYWHSRVED